jgi:hypothetical protein
MTALLVDTAAMHGLAERIRQAAALAGPSDRAALRSAATALGPPALAHAAGTFIDHWGLVLAELVDDTHRLADAIDLAARTYQDADSATQVGVLR